MPIAIAPRRRWLRWWVWPAAFVAVVAVLLLGPLGVLASGQVSLDRSWWGASRDSAGLAPDPAADREAIVQVYGARTVSWRGAFGIHPWIAVKRSGEARFTTYQVLGWRAYRGGRAVESRETMVPDGRWFGALPALLAERRGPGVDALIDRIEAAVARYPWPDSYRVWPGPNSNTFVAYVARQVPELRLDLPANAIGKDFLGLGSMLAPTPSGTGWQLSLGGLLGIALARDEGIELNLLGLSVGFDVDDAALRLPGFGRVAIAGLLPGGAPAAAPAGVPPAGASPAGASLAGVPPAGVPPAEMKATQK
ncbi:MAG: DUF3750 domain-containing protein [Lautropia sp.]